MIGSEGALSDGKRTGVEDARTRHLPASSQHRRHRIERTRDVRMLRSESAGPHLQRFLVQTHG